MGLSILDLFKVGLGPSSSHTVGPMVAANRFIDELKAAKILEQTHQIRIELYGSLAMTGEGHATDTAIMLGLLGEKPELISPDQAPLYIKKIRQSGQISLDHQHVISFSEKDHLQFCMGQSLSKHPNGMILKALDSAGIIIHQERYYSVGGGFVLNEQETDDQHAPSSAPSLLHPFDSGQDLLNIGF